MTDAQRLARLEAQLAELESLYTHAPVGLCFVDTDLRYVRVNERMAAINGRTIEAHLGNRVEEVVPSIADQVGPVYRRILRTGEPVVGLEVRGKLPSDPYNEHVWLVNHHPVRSPEGELQGISTVVIDITELREAEAATRQLSLVFMNAADPIVIEDLSGNVIDLNREAERSYGWGRDTLIGKPIKRIVPKDRHHQADDLLRRCLAGEEVRNVQGIRIARDGSRYDVLLTLSLLQDGWGISLAGGRVSR